MKFSYRAYDIAGREQRDAIDAASIGEAEELLRKKGLFIAEIGAGALAAATAQKSAGWRLKGSSRTQRLKDLASFMRQLSVLVSTGTPLVEAMTALERQVAPGEWRTVVADLRVQVEEGRQLSEAMVRHPRYFDAVCRSLISAGESGGQIEAMLKRLSALVRQQLKIRSNLVGAMVYPILLIFVSIGVMGAMFGFVLPRFEDLFKNLDSPLPATTKILMDISAFVKSYWYLVIGGAIGSVFGARFWLGTPAGRRWLHGTVVRLPQFGKIFRALATARIARVLGVLLEGKVPLLEALQLTRESTGNLCYSELVQKAEERVTRGDNISSAFADSPLIPLAVTEAIRSGEKTGQMAPVLTSIADYLDEDNEVVIRSLTSIVEPMILMALGLVVGFVAISMFLPLFDLTASAGSGG